MVGGVLGDVTAQLRHFDVGLELTLEAREENFALRRLETVHHAGNRAQQVGSREQNELLVDKFVVSNVFTGHV